MHDWIQGLFGDLTIMSTSNTSLAFFVQHCNLLVCLELGVVQVQGRSGGVRRGITPC